MASTYLKKASSQQQIALILPVTGKRVIRSLHTSDPQKATQISDKVQTLADTLTGPDKQRQSVLRVLVEDVFLAAGVPNPWAPDEVPAASSAPTFSSFAGAYIDRKAATESVKSFNRSVCMNFALTVAGKNIDQITGIDCQSWYDSMSAGLSYGTAKNRLACISSVFRQATKIRVIQSNPCDHIQTKAADASPREEFTDAEVEKILSHLEAVGAGDWYTAVMLARWAGLRLMDAVCLKRSNVISDGIGGYSIQYLPEKTKRSGKIVVVPCCQVLADHLRPIVWIGGDEICPQLCACSNSMLSNAFAEIMDEAGIDCGKTQVNRRTVRKKTFHSFRHNFAGWLMRLGMPEEQRMLLAGHSNSSVHKGYIHRKPDDVIALTSQFINPPSTQA